MARCQILDPPPHFTAFFFFLSPRKTDVRHLLLLILAGWCTMSVCLLTNHSLLWVSFGPFSCSVPASVVLLKASLNEKAVVHVSHEGAVVLCLVAPIVRDSGFLHQDITCPSGMFYDSDVMNPGVTNGTLSISSTELAWAAGPNCSFQSVADANFEQRLKGRSTPCGSLDWKLSSRNSSHDFHCRSVSFLTDRQ